MILALAVILVGALIAWWRGQSGRSPARRRLATPHSAFLAGLWAYYRSYLGYTVRRLESPVASYVGEHTPYFLHAWRKD
jgi:hypothetical protein